MAALLQGKFEGSSYNQRDCTTVGRVTSRWHGPRVSFGTCHKISGGARLVMQSGKKPTFIMPVTKFACCHSLASVIAFSSAPLYTANRKPYRCVQARVFPLMPSVENHSVPANLTVLNISVNPAVGSHHKDTASFKVEMDICTLCITRTKA